MGLFVLQADFLRVELTNGFPLWYVYVTYFIFACALLYGVFDIGKEIFAEEPKTANPKC